NQPVEAQGPSSIKMARRLVKRNPWPIVAGGVVLAAVAVVAAVLSGGEKPPPAPPPAAQPAGAATAPPDPEGEARRRKEEAERKWQEDWLALRPRLDYDRWDAADGALGPAAAAVLQRLEGEAARRDAVNETDWLDREARRVLSESERLGKDRDRARRMAGWCDTLIAAMKDVPSLGPTRALVQQARGRAAAVADYRGSITLKIAPGPWANVVKATRDGKPLALPAKATPLVLPNLEIGDFELELSHPQHGTRTIRIPAAQLKDGATYVAGGLMKDAELRLAPQ
ncbi:MAG TPA: hypothetical protein VEJ18_04110, partial [Planctomycetota bacterium]|nr:hypothetical protein [Planctomycetota bacterium]